MKHLIAILAFIFAFAQGLVAQNCIDTLASGQVITTNHPSTELDCTLQLVFITHELKFCGDTFDVGVRVSAGGQGLITYEWEKNGIPLYGFTTWIPNQGPGVYIVTVSDSICSRQMGRVIPYPLQVSVDLDDRCRGTVYVRASQTGAIWPFLPELEYFLLDSSNRVIQRNSSGTFANVPPGKYIGSVLQGGRCQKYSQPFFMEGCRTGINDPTEVKDNEKYVIFDLLGRKIGEGIGQLNVARLISGTYFAHWHSKKTQKFIILDGQMVGRSK